MDIQIKKQSPFNMVILFCFQELYVTSHNIFSILININDKAAICLPNSLKAYTSAYCNLNFVFYLLV